MKHSLRKFLYLTGVFLIAILLCAIFFSSSRFTAYCDRLFCKELAGDSLTMHYTLAEPEKYKIPSGLITLGSFDTGTFQKRLWLLKNQLALHTFDRGLLSREQQITYDLLKHSFRTEYDLLEFWMLEEALVPSIGIQSQLPILLAEYHFYEEADVINYLTLLSCVPEYFDSLLALEEIRCAKGLFPDGETVCQLIDYCEQFLGEGKAHFLAKTFEERIHTLSLSEEKKNLYIQENTFRLDTCIFPAYQRLKDFLTEHKNSGTNENGLYYAPEGRDYYACLLRTETGSDRSFEEIEAILDHALKEDAGSIASLIKKNPKLSEERYTISIDASNPAGLISYLSKRAARDFPETKQVSVEVCTVPESLEAHLSPAFYLVPPLDHIDRNAVYLNNGYLKEGISFFTTLAHESYPGHLYQTVYENSSLSHPIHRLLYFGGYVEGWATYAEQLSYFYAPISTDLAALLSCSRAMTLNIYSHLDLYVHGYGWTEEDCAQYLKKFGITAAASVHEIFLLVKQQPANYLKYYLGYLEICELKKQAEEALGEDFDLKEFHRFLLDYGPAPFSLLKKYMEEWLHSPIS